MFRAHGSIDDVCLSVCVCLCVCVCACACVCLCVFRMYTWVILRITVVFCVEAIYKAKNRGPMFKNYINYQNGLPRESLSEKFALKG